MSVRLALLAVAFAAAPAAATSCRVDVAVNVVTPYGQVTANGYHDEGVASGERGRGRVDVSVLGLPPYYLDYRDVTEGPGPVQQRVPFRALLCP